MRHTNFTAVLRFRLIDESERLYSVDRWCFRGRIDNWINLMADSAPLEDLAREYLPHLGEDSFYELM